MISETALVFLHQFRDPLRSLCAALLGANPNLIGQYLSEPTCPRRYRHRYLDGWIEVDTRTAMLFGRAFERALGAVFRREDPGAVLFTEWSACQNEGLHYSNGDSWDRMLQQGIMLLTRFAKTVACRSSSLDKICRSSSRVPWATRTTSSPISTPLENSMASGVFWSGKRLPADTRKNQGNCCLWIRSWFVIRG